VLSLADQVTHSVFSAIQGRFGAAQSRTGPLLAFPGPHVAMHNDSWPEKPLLGPALLEVAGCSARRRRKGTSLQENPHLIRLDSTPTAEWSGLRTNAGVLGGAASWIRAHR